jgi:hypothetical protein
LACIKLVEKVTAGYTNVILSAKTFHLSDKLCKADIDWPLRKKCSMIFEQINDKAECEVAFYKSVFKKGFENLIFETMLTSPGINLGFVTPS